MPAPDVHADLEPLSFLLGAWHGGGDGEFPTIGAFRRGFLRPPAPGRVELLLAHPLGLTEVAEGTLEGTVMTTASTAMGRTTTGDPVTELVRRWRVDGDRLSVELDLATEMTPLARHLTGELRRV